MFLADAVGLISSLKILKTTRETSLLCFCLFHLVDEDDIVDQNLLTKCQKSRYIHNCSRIISENCPKVEVTQEEPPKERAQANAANTPRPMSKGPGRGQPPTPPKETAKTPEGKPEADGKPIPVGAEFLQKYDEVVSALLTARRRKTRPR